LHGDFAPLARFSLPQAALTSCVRKFDFVPRASFHFRSTHPSLARQ
jgi:hypothetical protein